MSPLVSFFRTGLTVCLASLGLVCRSSGAAEIVAGSQDYPHVFNISQFRNAVSREGGRVCVLELHGMVLAADAAGGIVILQDDTGLEALQMNFQGTLQPGQKIHLQGTNYVVRTDYGLSFGKHPVVENDGLHSQLERAGTVYLRAGRHPFQVSWFNYTVDSFLELSWQGPGGGRARIPEAALFRCEPQPGEAGQSFVAGLDFRCFEGPGQKLFDFENLHPVKTGVVSNLDVNVKTRNEHVALEFAGFLEVPTNGVYTFHLDSDDGSRLFLDDAPPRWTVVGAEPLPVPRPIVSGELLPTGQAPFWGQVTGTITYLSRQQNGAELELGAAANGLRVKILSSRDGLPIHLLRARVRINGICLNTRNADGQPGVALLEAPNWESVQVLEVAPEYWTSLRSVKLNELTATHQTGADAAVHVIGRLSARSPEGLMTLEEGTNFIFLELLNPLASKVGDQVECLGRWGRRGTNMMLREAVVRSLAPEREEPAETPLPLLTTAAQVQQLKREEARRGYPVQLRGVVTWVSDHYEALVIQDSTRAVFVTIGSVWKSNMPSVGEYLEIEGVSDPADFSPIVKMTKVTRLGVGRMPTPVSPTLEQMINGSLDAQYVELSGFVTAAQSNALTLFTRTGPIELNVTLNSAEPLTPYLHAMIRLRGALFANWDPISHQVIPNLAPLLKSASLHVDVPASVDPFRVQTLAAAELLQFNVQSETFRRVRISAQVLQGGGGLYYVMDGGIGVRIQPTQPVEIRPGEIVDVVGFVDLGGVSPVLREAMLRKTGQAPLPVARKLDLSQLNGPYDSTRVWVEGLLVDMKESGTEQVLEVQVGLKSFIARLRSKEKPKVHWLVGSRLKLTGVFVGLGGSRMEKNDVNSFELLLNSASDVEVVAQPPWWTLPRLLVAIAVLAVGLLLTFLWITVLRRQVERRTVQLQHEIGGRERAEKERAIEQERARIARDLHDDVGSNVTEINMLAMTALEMKIKPEERGEFLQLIADKSGSMVTVLDELVWAVNPKNDTLASLAEYLASFAEEYFSRTQINCQVEIPPTFPNKTVVAEARHHVVLAVREVFNNAIRHGKPSEVSLRLILVGEQFEIVIQDNGVGFDLKRHPQGNGLANLRERMNELKGQCRIQSQPGQGTQVLLGLPL